MAVPPLCLDTPYSSPDGDLDDDGDADVIDVQLAVNVFLGTQLDPTIVGRADTRVCNTTYITAQTVKQITDIFLVGYS